MLRLRPYKNCDAPLIAGWLDSEVTMHKWCANAFTEYPLSAQALRSYYADREDRDNYFELTAFDEQGPVGHLIMEFRDEAKSVLWIGFVVIDPARRGQGLGREMMAQAIRFGFEIAGAQKLTLAVFKNNPPAMRCYESLGFRYVPNDRPPLTVMGEPWDAGFMELLRGDERL